MLVSAQMDAPPATEPPACLSARQLSLLSEIEKSIPDSPLLMRKRPKEERVIDAVLAWKPEQCVGAEMGTQKRDATENRLFLVKWKNTSDVHCCWSGLEDIRDRLSRYLLPSGTQRISETAKTTQHDGFALPTFQVRRN